MNNGWTPPIDPKTKCQNEIAAVTEILAEDPGNSYWDARLDELLADECACTYEIVDGEIIKAGCDLCEDDYAEYVQLTQDLRHG